MEDLTGKQLGPYQIVAPLGEGGMAAVYKAYQPGMDRYVALKILPRHFASDPQFVARFEQEAKVLAKLQNPHILPVFDFGQVDGYTYIVMPFLQSGDLTDLLKGQPLPLSQLGQIISQVGDALDYAHSRGLVHRDVKPSNVLLDERGNCLLTDFGIAKIVEGSSKLTATGGILGTPAYMSPEQGMAQKLDGRSDIYSLGIMLYELATGRVPYQAETPMAVMIKHLNDPLPLPHQVNPALPEPIERVILRALAKQPEDRYATAGEMVRALQAAIAESGPGETLPDDKASTVTAATTPTLEARSQKAISTPKWILAAGALAIVLLVGAIIFFASGSGWKGETEAAVIQSVEATMETAPVTVTATNTNQVEMPNEASPTVTAITEVPTPAAKTPTDPAIYDDFNDPTYDGKINSSLWIEDSPELCNWYQEKGVMVLRNTPPQDGIICLLIIGRPTLVKVDGLKTEARIQILDSHNRKGADLGISFRTKDTGGEEWEAFCGLTAGPGGVDAVFDATHEQQIRRQAAYNLWYTLRFEIDPDMMTFNCFVNDKLLHSVIPANAAELKNAQFRRGLRGFRDAGAFAITNADDIRVVSGTTHAVITPTVGVESNPTVYDDFNDPAYDGTINASLWIKNFPSSCTVVQNEGMMIFKNIASATDYECYLIVGHPSQTLFDELGVFEAKVKISSNHNGEFVNGGINIMTRDSSGLVVSCLLQAGGGDVKTEFSAANWRDKSQDAYLTMPAEYDRWYNLRLEVNPDTQTISCFVDGDLLGSIVVKNTPKLKNTLFERNLSTYRSSGSIATTYVDEVRTISGGVRVADAPTEEVVTDATVYDNFNNPAFDGKLNTSLWRPSVTPPSYIEQREGVLILSLEPEAGEIASLFPVETLKSNLFNFAEAKIFLSSEKTGQDGDISFSLVTTLEDGHNLIFSCLIYRRAPVQVGCEVYGRGDEAEYLSERTITDFDVWHTVRIEMDSEINATFYIDGQQVGSYRTSDAEEIKGKVFAPRLEVFSPKQDGIEAHFDDVRVGQLPTSKAVAPTDTPIPPTSTPTPAPAVASIVSGTLLFEEDFEDNKVQGIGFSAESGWKFVTDETGNKVYEIDNRNGPNYKGFSFGMPEWKDYSLEYRARFLSSTGKQSEIGSQYRSDGNSYYVLDFSEGELYLAYSIKGSEWTRLITQFPHIERNIWYNIKVDVQGEQISVYLDDTLLINAKSSEIKQGWAMIFVGPDTHAQIDDIRVVVLGE